MPCRPFRLLHASDLHLERPVRGLAAAPPPIRELLIDAPYRAAERIFAAAIADQVDLVILAGDIVAPYLAGPRGLSFFFEQFETLAAKNVSVYWAMGKADAAARWAQRVDFSPNVHILPAGTPLERVQVRDGLPLCRLIGASWERGETVAIENFRPDPDGLFTIGVAYGSTTPETLKKQQIGYLALGGRHDRFTCSTGAHGAHYPGTPQGRTPEESGPHGCTIVDVDEAGRTRTRFVATDVLRWQRERVALEQRMALADLEDLLAARAQSLRERIGPVDLLIRFCVFGPGIAGLPSSKESFAESLATNLRRRFAKESPLIWIDAVLFETPLVAPPAEEDSLAADFYKLLRAYEHDSQRRLDLSPLLAASAPARLRKAAGELAAPVERQAALAQIARLGLDLLGPRPAATPNQQREGVAT
jgi:hypothetical protein